MLPRLFNIVAYNNCKEQFAADLSIDHIRTATYNTVFLADSNNSYLPLTMTRD